MMAASRRTILFIAAAVLVLLVFTGCAKEEPIGPIVNEAGLVYMSPEIPAGEEAIGILYRRILDFDGFLAKADVPVLILVSSHVTPLDPEATLLLEQLAYEYSGRAECIRVEADEYPDIAAFCDAGTLPCFATVVKGALHNTTGELSAVSRDMIVAMLADVT